MLNTDNRVKTTFYATEKNKDIIKLKAQRLKISISDLLCLLGSKLNVDEEVKLKLHNVIEENKEIKKSKEPKATISFRAKKEDLIFLEEKAKNIDMSLENYLISVSLLVDIEIDFK